MADDPSDSHSCTYKGMSDELQDSFLNVICTVWIDYLAYRTLR